MTDPNSNDDLEPGLVEFIVPGPAWRSPGPSEEDKLVPDHEASEHRFRLRLTRGAAIRMTASTSGSRQSAARLQHGGRGDLRPRRHRRHECDFVYLERSSHRRAVRAPSQCERLGLNVSWPDLWIAAVADIEQDRQP